MAYKRISPLPIVEGGSNASTLATTNGTLYFDGTRLVTTATGTAGQRLTSNGAAAPTYQNAGGGGGSTSFMISRLNGGFTGGDVISLNDGINPNFYGAIFGFGSQGDSATDYQFPVPISGTLSNLYVSVLSNGSGNAITYSLWHNGSTTALAVTIGAGATGLFTNTATSVAVNAGDRIQFIATSTASGGQIVRGHTTVQFSS